MILDGSEERICKPGKNSAEEVCGRVSQCYCIGLLHTAADKMEAKRSQPQASRHLGQKVNDGIGRRCNKFIAVRRYETILCISLQ